VADGYGERDRAHLTLYEQCVRPITHNIPSRVALVRAPPGGLPKKKTLESPRSQATLAAAVASGGGGARPPKAEGSEARPHRSLFAGRGGASAGRRTTQVVPSRGVGVTQR
jgi:hypothetical protein